MSHQQVAKTQLWTQKPANAMLMQPDRANSYRVLTILLAELHQFHHRLRWQVSPDR